MEISVKLTGLVRYKEFSGMLRVPQSIQRSLVM